MGAEARAVVYAGSEAEARAAALAAFARIDELDDALSDWNADSELMRLCAGAGGPPAPVGADLFAVLSLAQEFSAASHGAFDVTVGPLTHLWREARRADSLPAAAEIERARASVGWQQLQLDAGARTVRLELPLMQLDLGGIAPGYACDRALELVRMRGIDAALIELSGDFALGDAPPGKTGWTLRAGCADDGSDAIDLCLANCGVSTSGDSDQHLDAGGQRYSHVLDPRTGLGVTNRLCVTAIAPDAATADALATAACVLDEPAARALAARHGAELHLIVGSPEPINP